MRGHWLSQTRKLNHHYQSGSGGDKVWIPNNDALVPTDCVFAPYYCAFVGGTPLFKTDVTSLTYVSSEVDPKVGISKVDVNVRPYIPRVSDHYYDWDASQGTQQELDWIAHDDGCVLRFWDTDGIGYQDIMTIPAGTDFKTEQFDLIKPVYDYYIFRVLDSDCSIYDTYNIQPVYDSLSSGKIKYDFKATKRSIVSPASGYYHGLYGLFGEESKHDPLYVLNQGEPMFATCNKGMQTYPVLDRTSFMTGMTPPTSPDTQRSWSGIQYPSIWHTGCVNSKYPPVGLNLLPGFEMPSPGSFAILWQPMWQREDQDDGYRYCQVWILKELHKERGTIYG